jgi:hypothetical protein
MPPELRQVVPRAGVEVVAWLKTFVVRRRHRTPVQNKWNGEFLVVELRDPGVSRFCRYWGSNEAHRHRHRSFAVRAGAQPLHEVLLPADRLLIGSEKALDGVSATAHVRAIGRVGPLVAASLAGALGYYAAVADIERLAIVIGLDHLRAVVAVDLVEPLVGRDPFLGVGRGPEQARREQ